MGSWRWASLQVILWYKSFKGHSLHHGWSYRIKTVAEPWIGTDIPTLWLLANSVVVLCVGRVAPFFLPWVQLSDRYLRGHLRFEYAQSVHERMKVRSYVQHCTNEVMRYYEKLSSGRIRRETHEWRLQVVPQIRRYEGTKVRRYEGTKVVLPASR